jgi:hypothetical protein
VSGSNEPPRRFRVDRVASVFAEFEALIHEADVNGQAVAFASAMKRIMAGLRTRARDLGEPLWTLPHAHLEVRLVADRPVSVRFAVHRTAFEVVILKVFLMSPGV